MFIIKKYNDVIYAKYETERAYLKIDEEEISKELFDLIEVPCKYEYKEDKPNITHMQPPVIVFNSLDIEYNIERLKTNKIQRMSSICNQIIINGFDIKLSNTSGHCSLTAEDQINLSTAYNAVLQGATEYPYHLDGQLCQIFSAQDIISIAQMATKFKLYHTTYFNHLKAWVERCETQEEVDGIEYGSELPEDLKSSMESIINTVNKS